MSERTGTVSSGVWRRPMVSRNPEDEQRHATVLELFFDLCFVVAVAQAASGLHHAISEDHIADGVVGYVLVFFGIWWAWMNFTWFASAYDTDDVVYRLTTMVQITGALVFAAGVPRAMDQRDFAVATFGYVIMRLAMVTQWLRAAHADPARRRCCLRFAVGVTLVQIAWMARLALPEGLGMGAFVVLALAELAVPIWAERLGPTTWNPHHIAERYGLFTIIVLGESVLASTLAIQSALDAEVAMADLVTVVLGGMLTVFSMWWLYFAKDAARFLTSNRAGFRWGYGHYLIFGAAAAVGAGLAVNIDHAIGEAQISAAVAAASHTMPVAVFVLAMWVLQWVPHHVGRWHHMLAPTFAAAVLLATFTPEPVLVTGLLMSALVLAGILASQAAPLQPVATRNGSGPSQRAPAIDPE